MWPGHRAIRGMVEKSYESQSALPREGRQGGSSRGRSIHESGNARRTSLSSAQDGVTWRSRPTGALSGRPFRGGEACPDLFLKANSYRNGGIVRIGTAPYQERLRFSFETPGAQCEARRSGIYESRRCPGISAARAALEGDHFGLGHRKSVVTNLGLGGLDVTCPPTLPVSEWSA